MGRVLVRWMWMDWVVALGFRIFVFSLADIVYFSVTGLSLDFFILNNTFSLLTLWFLHFLHFLLRSLNFLLFHTFPQSPDSPALPLGLLDAAGMGGVSRISQWILAPCQSELEQVCPSRSHPFPQAHPPGPGGQQGLWKWCSEGQEAWKTSNACTNWCQCCYYPLQCNFLILSLISFSRSFQMET